MTKLILIILLVAICITFLGAINVLFRDPGRDLDIEDLFLSTWNGTVTILFLTTVMFIVRWIIQVKLSAQILLSFFFYSWRNSIYDGDILFVALFPSLETETCF